MSDHVAYGATRINVGLSAIIKLSTGDCINGWNLKILSGGGTLEIVPIPVALSGSSAVGWGLGYPVGATEIMNAVGPAVFYLAATGATMVVAAAPKYSAGVTLI